MVLRRPALHLLEDVGVLDVVGEGIDHRIVTFLHSHIEVVLLVVGGGADAGGAVGLIQVLPVPRHFC